MGARLLRAAYSLRNERKNLMNVKSKVLAAGTAITGALTAVPAFAAGDDLSSGVVTAITGVNPQIVSVVGAMAGALVLIVAWSLIRRAMGK
jgi:hypothetical protein